MLIKRTGEDLVIENAALRQQVGDVAARQAEVTTKPAAALTEIDALKRGGPPPSDVLLPGRRKPGPRQ